MLEQILIWLACHVFLFICLAIAWQLLEADNGRQNHNNHHLLDYQPRIDAQGRPHLRLPWLDRKGFAQADEPFRREQGIPPEWSGHGLR